jgi:SPP1 family predicted phage head-tail adaptor
MVIEDVVMLAAGRLNKLVTIQRNTPTQDGEGGPVDSWAMHKTVWASVEPLLGQERLLAQQVTATLSHKFRWRTVDAPAVTPRDRISWDGRYFDIHQVLDVREAGEETVVLAGEVV